MKHTPTSVRPPVVQRYKIKQQREESIFFPVGTPLPVDQEAFEEETDRRRMGSSLWRISDPETASVGFPFGLSFNTRQKGGALLWMHNILHHLGNPGRMIPL